MKTINTRLEIQQFIKDNLSHICCTIREMETSENGIDLNGTEYAHLKSAIAKLYDGANPNELIRTFVVTAALEYCSVYGNYFTTNNSV